MADVVSISLIVIIAGSVLFLAWYTARRDWNVDRQDDKVREEQATPLVSDDEEEG